MESSGKPPRVPKNFTLYTLIVGVLLSLLLFPLLPHSYGLHRLFDAIELLPVTVVVATAIALPYACFMKINTLEPKC